MSNFKEIETCLECSAKNLVFVAEVRACSDPLNNEFGCQASAFVESVLSRSPCQFLFNSISSACRNCAGVLLRGEGGGAPHSSAV